MGTHSGGTKKIQRKIVRGAAFATFWNSKNKEHGQSIYIYIGQNWIEKLKMYASHANIALNPSHYRQRRS